MLPEVQLHVRATVDTSFSAVTSDSESMKNFQEIAFQALSSTLHRLADENNNTFVQRALPGTEVQVWNVQACLLNLSIFDRSYFLKCGVWLHCSTLQVALEGGSETATYMNVTVTMRYEFMDKPRFEFLVVRVIMDF